MWESVNKNAKNNCQWASNLHSCLHCFVCPSERIIGFHLEQEPLRSPFSECNTLKGLGLVLGFTVRVKIQIDLIWLKALGS